MYMKDLQANKDFRFQLDKKCKQIGIYLLSCKFDRMNDIGLMDGLAGMGLLLSLYYRKTYNDRYLYKLEQVIKAINNVIRQRKYIQFSYGQGLAGYGWLLIYLKENDILEVDLDNYLAEIDNYLYEGMIFLISKKEYDPLFGAVGIGTYFIKRKNIGAIKNIIDGLYRDRKNINGYHVICRNNQHTHRNDIDFGMAHGIPGILVFMYKCYLNHFSSERCSEMIWDHINLMMSFLNESGSPSYFRYTVEIDQIMYFDKKLNWSRLGWCYGDLSALYVLFQLSESFTLNIDVIDMLEHVAKRRTDTGYDIYSSEFCHGTSGIAHLFNKLYICTGNHLFNDACSYWLEQTLFSNNVQEIIVNSDSQCNLKSDLSGLLSGIFGIGCVIISYLNSDLIDWDEAVFLS